MTPLEAIRTFEPKPEEAYVGFSGGADSTALLLAMVQCGWKVTAVHFNHHLRGAESDADELWCRKFCERRGIPLEVIDLQVNEQRKPGEGVEAAARWLRLEAWKRLVEKEWRPIFLAHHVDDCLEELFLRLGRGANASGLTSLRPERELDNLTLCRPFLQLRKHDLEEWLRGQGIDDWRIDQTNLEADSSRRNAIRNRLLPLVREIFGTDAGFLAALQCLREDAECLEKIANEESTMYYYRASLIDWNDLHPAILVRVLRECAELPFPPSRRTVERLRSALAAGKSEQVPIGQDCVARVTPDGVFFCHRQECPETTWDWRRLNLLVWGRRFLQMDAFSDGGFLQDDETECFDEAVLPDQLVVRCWRPGDVIQPFGSQHHRKVVEFFQEKHVIPEERKIYPVVCVGETIIWVPGVCRAEFGRVTEASERIAQFSFERN